MGFILFKCYFLVNKHKDQELRFKILHYLKFVSDVMVIKLQYRVKVSRRLNLKHTQRYTEKLEW